MLETFKVGEGEGILFVLIANSGTLDRAYRTKKKTGLRKNRVYITLTMS